MSITKHAGLVGETNLVVQGPADSGFAGPWSVWDVFASSFNGAIFTDDAVLTGLHDEASARRAAVVIDRERRERHAAVMHLNELAIVGRELLDIFQHPSASVTDMHQQRLERVLSKNPTRALGIPAALGWVPQTADDKWIEPGMGLWICWDNEDEPSGHVVDSIGSDQVNLEDGQSFSPEHEGEIVFFDLFNAEDYIEKRNTVRDTER
jgi:hypothetical protein